MMVTMSACYNDGDIGNLYGFWRIESYTIDGEDAMTEMVENTIFSFQNDIVQVKWPVDDYLTYNYTTGTWTREGNEMSLNFTHHDDQYAHGTGIYEAPAWLSMTSSEIMHMTYTSDASHRFNLSWVDPQGRHIAYTFDKCM